MKKNIPPFLPLILSLFLLLSTPALATTPIDYCDRQLEQEIRSTYNLENLDQYRAYLREALNHSREVLQHYLDTGGGDVAIPPAIVRDILLAENANEETGRLIETLRLRYAPSPELLLSDRDFEDFTSLVLEGAVVAKWQQCKTVCSECLADANGKQNGILYRVHGDEHGVFAVTFTYLPERKTDPVSVMVTGMTVTDGATPNAPEIIRRSAILHRYNGYTQTFTRTDPKIDVSIRVDLDGREGVQIRISDRRPEAGMPVGMVVQSIMPWEEYAKAANDTLPYNSRLNYWAPCDGRAIEGSRLQESTDRPNAPDLRGVFLRGLNRFAPGDEDDGIVEVVSDEQKDPGEKKGAELVIRTEAGTFQGGNVGGHEHSFYGKNADAVRDAKKGDRGDIRDVWSGGDSPQRAERRTTKGPTGETRPKNISVHYYIKIN